MARLRRIVDFMEKLLETSSYQDWPNALNGLQIENGGRVDRIVAAVDGSIFSVGHAAGVPRTLLIVHHGLFWGGLQPVAGRLRRIVRAADAGDLAVYSSHLPLDGHPRLGNNRLLARAIGLTRLKPFLPPRGRPIGVKGECAVSRDTLIRRVSRACGSLPLKVCAGGPARVRRVGVVTGSAWPGVAALRAEGVDTFVTGEGPHGSYVEAEEAGINVIYGGHYATETLGVRALAERVSREFGVPWEFYDHPTGM